VRANVAGGVLTEDHFIELIIVGGVVAGVLDNGQFTALLTDPRGTPFAGPDGTPGLATPYGVRASHLGFAEAIDYARLGWDPDLDVIRMGVRDYDAKLSQFLTPDPLFFEDLDRCQSSPLQCTLYGYASGNPISFVDPTGQQDGAVLTPQAQQAFAAGLATARILAASGATLGAYGIAAASVIIIGYLYYQYSLVTPNPLPTGHGEWGPTIYESYKWAERQEALDKAAAAQNLKAAEDFKAMASNIKKEAERAAANDAKAAASQAATPPGGMEPRDRPPSSDGGGGGSGVWKPPGAAGKIPSSWGEGSPTKKGVGMRWQDPANEGNGVRIDKGDPGNSQATQQVDHVVVRSNGKVIGRNGEAIPGSVKQNAVDAHIPLSEWVNWSSWNHP
jgi:RHS repeat-associated protein